MNSTTMAGLKQEQLDFIRSLNDQGILDNNFSCLFEIRDKTENPQFVIEVLSIFCSNADISIADLNQYMNESAIQFDKVFSCAHHLKGCAGGIGCCRLAPACVQLHHAARDMDKERSIEAFNKVKDEYQTVKAKLDEIIRRERQILVWETIIRRRFP